MIQCVNTAVVQGIEGIPVRVECDVSDGLPGFEMVGYLSSQVKEAGQRVKSALKNSGYKIPAKKIIVNLSPASIRKTGNGFDLPVLLGIAAGYGYLKSDTFDEMLVVGEVSLTGSVLPVTGVLPIVSMGSKLGYKLCVVPKDNVEEAQLQKGIKVLGVENIKELLELLNNTSYEQLMNSAEEKKKAFSSSETGVSHDKGDTNQPLEQVDFLDVYGNQLAKRAALISAAGRHNLLFIGTPGSGKTMLASRIPTILPELTEEEALEVTKIYSVSGMMDNYKKGMKSRPFRSPHHSITLQSLIGGGNKIRPGEISLAHKGVLFLDELPEFQSKVLEALRQPLEDGKVHLSRVWGNVTIPADVIFVCAMNPCPCGYYPDYSRCHCSDGAIKKYLGKISGPLLDRIDLCVEVSELKYEDMERRRGGLSSEEMGLQVHKARKIQRQRFQGMNIQCNGEMGVQEVEQFCTLDGKTREWLQGICQVKQISVRRYHRILKVARTIADIAEREEITRIDLEEAIMYRSLDEKYWGR